MLRAGLTGSGPTQVPPRDGTPGTSLGVPLAGRVSPPTSTEPVAFGSQRSRVKPPTKTHHEARPAPRKATSTIFADEDCLSLYSLAMKGTETAEVLVTVNAYPQLSRKSGEVVCVAGMIRF